MPKKTILIVHVGGDITNPISGGQKRVYKLSVGLARKGNDVIVLQPEPNQREANFDVKTFTEFPVSNLNDFNLSLLYNIWKILENNDVDVIQIAGMAGVALSKILSLVQKRDIQVIYDSHNVEVENIDSYLDEENAKYKNLAIPPIIRLLEKSAVHLSDHIISVSKSDKNTFMERYAVRKGKIDVISSGADFQYDLKGEQEVRTALEFDQETTLIVFHGSFDYRPNLEAAKIIDEYIAPRLDKKDQETEILIAGPNLPAGEWENIHYMGFIEDLPSFLNASDIAIVPLVRGGGTKLKVLDYLSVGLPIVTTEKGSEGLELADEKHLLVSDGVDEEFISNIEQLIDNPDYRDELGERGRDRAERLYAWEKIASDLDSLYEELTVR